MDLSRETEAYAAYANSHARACQELKAEELAEFEEDLAKARRTMEIAWLELGQRHPQGRLHMSDIEPIDASDQVVPVRVKAEHYYELMGSGLKVDGFLQLVKQPDGVYGLRVSMPAESNEGTGR